MAKSTKQAVKPKRRTQVKNLPVKEKDVTAAEAKKVKGGDDWEAPLAAKPKSPQH